MLKGSAEAGWVAIRESCDAKTPVPERLDVSSPNSSIWGPQSPGKPCSAGDTSFSPHHGHRFLDVAKESLGTLFCW